MNEKRACVKKQILLPPQNKHTKPIRTMLGALSFGWTWVIFVLVSCLVFLLGLVFNMIIILNMYLKPSALTKCFTRCFSIASLPIGINLNEEAETLWRRELHSSSIYGWNVFRSQNETLILWLLSSLWSQCRWSIERKLDENEICLQEKVTGSETLCLLELPANLRTAQLSSRFLQCILSLIDPKYLWYGPKMEMSKPKF